MLTCRWWLWVTGPGLARALNELLGGSKASLLQSEPVSRAHPPPRPPSRTCGRSLSMLSRDGFECFRDRDRDREAARDRDANADPGRVADHELRLAGACPWLMGQPFAEVQASYPTCLVRPRQ